MKKIDFSKYQFRASQSHLLMTGTIGCTDAEKRTISESVSRKMGAALGETEMKKGKEVPIKPLAPGQAETLRLLLIKQKDRTLPKTMITELRKIHRMETYNRNFPFTNAYVKKGIQQEEEGITLYQNYRNKILKIPTSFSKNTERIKNEWFSGEPDLGPKGVPILEWKEGFDVKCPYSLLTLPFKVDELKPIYEAQNQVYMNLTGADKWTTAYCLVNDTEQAVFNEKQKWMYSLMSAKHGNPESNPEHPFYEEYVSKCKDVEKMMIFDYKRYGVQNNPVMEIKKDDWFGEGFDIPMEDRVIEFVSERNDDFIGELKARIRLAREYLNSLS